MSFKITTLVPNTPRRSSSAFSEAATSCPSQPVMTTSLSMRCTLPSISGVMSAEKEKQKPTLCVLSIREMMAFAVKEMNSSQVAGRSMPGIFHLLSPSTL